jgi:hypothetical protein
MQLFTLPKKSPPSFELRALALKSGGIGFTTASLPKLRIAVAELERLGGVLTISHDFVAARFLDCPAPTFAAARSLLVELGKDSDFVDSSVGIAEGEAANEIDVMRICGDALKNARV